MPSLSVRSFSAALVLTLGVSALTAQTTVRDPSKDARTPASRSAKGPLPDPALLDGSTLEAEKRPEYGMLGEFEMPGDENSKSDRVGQTSEQPPPPGGGGGSQSPQDPTKSGGGGGAPPPSQQADQAAQSGGGSAGAENQAGGQQGGGQQAGGQQSGGGGSKSSGSQANAGGAAEGMQVNEMGGPSSGGSGQSAASAKPQQVALGDSAMQIKSQGSTAPNVVGAQPVPAGKEVPQAYDQKTPGGGRQSGNGSGNQGVEKGRVMPSGI